MQLTKEQADKLIAILKHIVEQAITFPVQKGGIKFTVTGEQRNDEFIVNIDRKGIALEKCTYQGRVKKDNTVLMRIDIDPNGRHTNPGENGETIIGNHIHIYTEEYGMSYAMSLDIQDKSFYELCYLFFEKFHIIEPPDVFYQETL